MYGLVKELVSQGVQATVQPEIRATVEALAALYQVGAPVGMRPLAKRLGLDVASASRRVLVARRSGWIVNQETRRGMPAQLVPGDPLPGEVPVLPDPESILPADEKKSAGTPVQGATLQHSPPRRRGNRGV